MSNYPDGIYFELDENEYHAIPRLSATGIKKLLVSPATFWASSWLNESNATEGGEDEESFAKIVGKAYHTARFEPDLFNARFAIEPDPSDYPGALMKDADVKEALKGFGEAQTKSGELAVDRARRLREAGYGGPIWALIVADFKESLGDRTALSAKVAAEILEDGERFAKSAEVASLFTGGAPEVSILWTCPETAIKMKCRVDYLTSSHWADLKTFANPQEKHLDQAVFDTFRFRRYHIQAGVYDDAIEMIRIGAVEVQSGADAGLIEAIRAQKDPLDCHFVFQEKGGTPNLIGYEVELYQLHQSAAVAEAGATEEGRDKMREYLTNPTPLRLKAGIEIMRGKMEFLRYSRVYDPGEPWAPLDPRRRLTSSDFPPYWLEEVGV